MATSRKPRPEWIDEARVETLAGYGLTSADIAEVLGIDRAFLEKSCRSALAGGRIKANARVAESLYRKATGEGREAVTAAIFWLKTRAQWKETSVSELTGPDGKPWEPVRTIRRIIISPPDPERLKATPGLACNKTRDQAQTDDTGQ